MGHEATQRHGSAGGLLIALIVLVAVLAIVWWAMNQMPLPQPVYIVLIAVLAILALLVLWQFLPGAGVHWPVR